MHERDSLATAARDGDPDALDRFVRLVQPDVWRSRIARARTALADQIRADDTDRNHTTNAPGEVAF